MTADTVNGLFELLGGLFIGLSVRKLWLDKRVLGFHWGQLAFYTSWGFWNLYYYPSLGQWLSFFGGVSVVTANSVYLGMIAYYTKWPGGK
jgi:hypothetical protein